MAQWQHTALLCSAIYNTTLGASSRVKPEDINPYQYVVDKLTRVAGEPDNGGEQAEAARREWRKGMHAFEKMVGAKKFKKGFSNASDYKD